MKEVNELSLKKPKISSQAIFLICAVILLYCPFFYTQVMTHYVEDTMIQIKTGMDCLKYKTFMPVERYSWHENLNWIKHEVAWYYVAGIVYKLLGVAGIIAVAAACNYAIAALCFRYNYKKVHPLIIVIAACVARMLSFPNYNARPHLFSQLMFVVLVTTMLSKKSTRTKCITFVITLFVTAWFHGGMMPVIVVSFAIFTVMEFIFKNYKLGLKYVGALVAGVAVSLLNPIGINAWIYPFKMTSEGAKYVWSNNMEFQPKTFSMVEMVLILLVFIGFAVDDRLRKFEKEIIIRLCFLCMFLIMACQHCRFMNFVALTILLLGAEQIQVLFNWINDNMFKIKKDIFNFNNISYYILAVFCAGYAVFMTVFSWTTYFPTNTMSDCSNLAAYDEGVIDCIKEHGYERIYNNFDSGTWLAFYDVKVHIDNRVDLYLPQYSGEDYFNGYLVMTDIDQADEFYEKYSPDAFVIESFPGTTDEFLLEDMMASPRYTVVYDEIAVSSYDPGTTLRWTVFQCNY